VVGEDLEEAAGDGDGLTGDNGGPHRGRRRASSGTTETGAAAWRRARGGVRVAAWRRARGGGARVRGTGQGNRERIECGRRVEGFSRRFY
jgi:hypothetical protein